MEIQGKRVSVCRRRVGKVRTKAFYVKATIGGKQILRGIGEVTKARAIEAAKLIVNAVMPQWWDPLRDSKLRKEAPGASIAQLLKAPEHKIHDFAVTLEARTADDHRNALKTVLRGVHAGDVGDVGRLSCTVYNEQLAAKYFENHVRSSGEDLMERDRRIRGAKSTLNWERSVLA